MLTYPKYWMQSCNLSQLPVLWFAEAGRKNQSQREPEGLWKQRMRRSSWSQTEKRISQRSPMWLEGQTQKGPPLDVVHSPPFRQSSATQPGSIVAGTRRVSVKSDRHPLPEPELQPGGK